MKQPRTHALSLSFPPLSSRDDDDKVGKEREPGFEVAGEVPSSTKLLVHVSLETVSAKTLIAPVFQ